MVFFALKVFLAALPIIGAAPVFDAQAQGVSCTCRYKGQDYGLGESICLKGQDGPRMATCGMVLNNTSWRFSDAPCPVSRLNMTPANAWNTPWRPLRGSGLSSRKAS